MTIINNNDNNNNNDNAMIGLKLFASLPPPLLARVFSHQVQTTSDIARFRLDYGSFGRHVLGAVVASGGSRHFIKSPTKRLKGQGCYVDELSNFDVPFDHCYDSFSICVGDMFSAPLSVLNPFVFERVQAQEMLFIGRPMHYKDFKKDSSFDALLDQNDDETLKALSSVLGRLGSDGLTMQVLQECYKTITEKGLLNPVARSGKPHCVPDPNNDSIFPVFLSLSVSKNSQVIKHIKSVDGVGEFLQLQSVDDPIGRNFTAIELKCDYLALIVDSDLDTYTAQIVLHTYGDGGFRHLIWSGDPQSLLIKEIYDKYERNEKEVEGIAIVDDLAGDELRNTLLSNVNALAAKQEKEKTVDYHPNSNDIVRDLVHPGIYSYIRDVSKLRAQPSEIDACIFPTVDEPQGNEQGETNNYWGRKYETSVYQWLPTYFSIAKDGTCTIEDYINNLTPREDAVHAALYDSLAKLFERSLPFIESVYSYVRAVRPLIRDYDEDDDDHHEELTEELQSLDHKYYPLRNQKLQVITKIVDYELKPGQEFNDVWHVEGMSHEEIVLTALYILDRDESGVTGGEIAFKRSFLSDEAGYVVSQVPQCRPQVLDRIIGEGLIPLGAVQTHKGRLVVFPNSHVHKVGTMINNAIGGEIGRLRIIVFFLVNPLRRIVSTREVAPQQHDGTMTHDEALAHRLNLMEERKLSKQDWNVRTIELRQHYISR